MPPIVEQLPKILGACGLALIGVSLLLRTTVGWSAEQAAELSQASADLHNQRHLHAHADHDHGPSHTTEFASHASTLQAAEARFANARAELEGKKFWRGSAASLCRWLGLFALGGALIAWQMLNRRA